MPCIVLCHVLCHCVQQAACGTRWPQGWQAPASPTAASALPECREGVRVPAQGRQCLESNSGTRQNLGKKHFCACIPELQQFWGSAGQGVSQGHAAAPCVILKTVQQQLNGLFLLFSLITPSLLPLLGASLSIHLSLLCMELNTVLKCGNASRLLALQFLGSCLL